MSDAPGLYPVVASGTPNHQDLDQLVQALQGALDPGTIALSAPLASPFAPSTTLQAGSLTGAYSWSAYWITGGINGAGTAYVNGRTPLGTATTTQALSSQEAVVSVPASPPSQAIGWGLCRTLAGGSVYYKVAEAFLPQIGGTWPQITDDSSDATIQANGTPQASNTTGTPMTFGAGATIPSGQTLAAAGATISGGPTFSDGATIAQGATLTAGGVGANLAGTWNGGVVNPGSGTVAGTWAMEGEVLMGAGTYFYLGAFPTVVPTAVGFGMIGSGAPPGYAAFFVNGAAMAATGALYANASPTGTTRAISIGDATGGAASIDANGNLSGRTLASNVATGTAPLAVASTTEVGNLNAGLWGGAKNQVGSSIAAPTAAGTSTGVGTSIVFTGNKVLVIGTATGLAGSAGTTTATIYRSTVGIPASGAGVGSGDVAIGSMTVEGYTGAGASGTTMVPIAVDTGLTQGTTYYYYLAGTAGESIVAVQF